LIKSEPTARLCQEAPHAQQARFSQAQPACSTQEFADGCADGGKLRQRVDCKNADGAAYADVATQ
jgi:hypothetical protein